MKVMMSMEMKAVMVGGGIELAYFFYLIAGAHVKDGKSAAAYGAGQDTGGSDDFSGDKVSIINCECWILKWWWR